MLEGTGSSRPLPLHQNDMTPWFESYHLSMKSERSQRNRYFSVEFSHWCRIVFLDLCVLTDHIVLDDLVHCKLILTI